MLILTLWANPLARKIIIGAGVLLAIFYALRLWSNRVYSEGFKTGKAAGLSEMEARKNAEWKAKADAIAADAAKTAADRRELEAQSSALWSSHGCFCRGSCPSPGTTTWPESWPSCPRSLRLC